jgi:hypothetical protein
MANDTAPHPPLNDKMKMVLWKVDNYAIIFYDYDTDNS